MPKDVRIRWSHIGLKNNMLTGSSIKERDHMTDPSVQSVTASGIRRGDGGYRLASITSRGFYPAIAPSAGWKVPHCKQAQSELKGRQNFPHRPLMAAQVTTSCRGSHAFVIGRVVTGCRRRSPGCPIFTRFVC